MVFDFREAADVLIHCSTVKRSVKLWASICKTLVLNVKREITCYTDYKKA